MFLEGFSVKVSTHACVFSIALLWFGVFVDSNSEGKRLLWLDKQPCEVQWVVSTTRGESVDQRRRADTWACSDRLYDEKRCAPWLKQPWNAANQPVWGYRQNQDDPAYQLDLNWISLEPFDISVSRATDLLHAYSRLCSFGETLISKKYIYIWIRKNKYVIVTFSP